jgi:recombination protein RecT
VTSRTAQLRDHLTAQPNGNTPAGATLVKRVDPARDLLASMEAEFAASLPKALPIDLFMRVALTGFRKTPDLLACSRRSLLGALLETARLGLEPCTEQAWLIPYKDECTLVVGYQGYVQLMYRTGMVKAVEAELIHEADEWAYEVGDGGKFFHRPRVELPSEKRGAPILAYSYAELMSGGRTKVCFVNREQAERIKNEYARAAKSPWKTGSFDAMWLKSPVRQVQKWAPKSAEIRRALVMDGATFDVGGVADVDPDVIDSTAEEVETPTEGTTEETPETGARTEQRGAEDPWASIDIKRPGGSA